MNLIQEVEETLRTHFSDPSDQITFIDEKGDGRHFLLTIISEKFTAISRLERSRLIYQLLDQYLKKDHIHALRLQLKTPNEL